MNPVDPDDELEPDLPREAPAAVRNFDAPLNVRLREARSRRRRLAALLGVLALPALVAAGSVLARPGMEDQLEHNATVAANSAGILGVKMRVTGQDLTVSGTVATAGDRLRLIQALSRVRELNRVNADDLKVSASAPPSDGGVVAILPLEAIYSEGKVTFSGTRPSKEAIAALLDATRSGLGQALVSDNMLDKGRESEAVDVGAYRKLGRSISQFPGMKVRSANLRIEDGVATISGVLGDASQRSLVLALLADVVGGAGRVRDKLLVETPTAPSSIAGATGTTTAAASTGSTPGTGVPGTDVPGTGVPGTGVPGTGVPATDVPGTGVPATDVPGTAVPSTSLRSVSVADARAAVAKIMKQGKISFATNLASLSEGRELIDQIAATLKGTALKVEVAGYTDNRGDPAKNQQLSQRRAQTVRAEMIAQGLTEAQVTAVGRGSEDPIASNDTAVGQALNRRIEFTISG